MKRSFVKDGLRFEATLPDPNREYSQPGFLEVYDGANLVNDSPIGFGIYRRDGNCTAEVGDFFLKKEFQRHNYGTRIWTVLKSIILEYKPESVSLLLRGSEGFWEKMGFVRDGDYMKLESVEKSSPREENDTLTK